MMYFLTQSGRLHSCGCLRSLSAPKGPAVQAKHAEFQMGAPQDNHSGEEKDIPLEACSAGMAAELVEPVAQVSGVELASEKSGKNDAMVIAMARVAAKPVVFQCQ